MSNPKKWLCEYCTYENFPSSIKCTMCNCQKALLNEDIFRLSPSQQCDNNQSIIEASSLSLSSTNLTSCGPSNQESSLNTSSISTKNTSTKWACSNCTYLNLSKASRCVQCSTSKRTESDMNLCSEQMKSLNIGDSDQDLLATSNRISPMGSATNLSGSRTNLGVGARISPVEQRGYPLNKLMCTVAQMLEEWLNHYRRIAQVMTAPFSRTGTGIGTTGYSSDGDTDEE